jgi:hypothetical protein
MSPSRRHLALLLAGWALLFHPALQAADGQLKSYTAQYRLSRGSLPIGTAEISLQIDSGGNYTYRSHTTPVGLVAIFRNDEITEISRGTIANRTVTPSSYHYRHKKKKATRVVNLSFDWRSRQVSNQADNSHWSMSISEGTQDKFSQQLALMLELAQGKHRVNFKVADGGRLKTYRFELKQEQTLVLPMGQYRTLKLERSKESRPSEVSLWLAPELNFLPVRIEKRKKKGLFVMELTALEWGDKTSP